MYVSNEQITYLTADCIANFIDKRKLNTITKLVLIENFISFTIFFTSKTFFWWIGFTFLDINFSKFSGGDNSSYMTVKLYFSVYLKLGILHNFLCHVFSFRLSPKCGSQRTYCCYQNTETCNEKLRKKDDYLYSKTFRDIFRFKNIHFETH